MQKLRGYLRLMRPANIVTAISDVLAGVAIAGATVSIGLGSFVGGELSLGQLILTDGTFQTFYLLLLLMLATACLYSGGVVMNDVFDAELDRVERPERPIPSGLIPKRSAATFGVVLLAAGIGAAALTVKNENFFWPIYIAAAIAAFALIYDRWGKHHPFFGPLNMGFCRGLNLLLGMSLIPEGLLAYWYIAVVPIVYIAAITMISRGEVHGGKRTTLYFAAFLYIVVLLSILAVAMRHDTLTKCLPFALIFCLMVFLPLQRAIIKPEAANIGKAVKAGVMALIIMNASWAAAFGDLIFAGAIILLFPISLLLSRAFAVT